MNNPPCCRLISSRRTRNVAHGPPGYAHRAPIHTRDECDQQDGRAATTTRSNTTDYAAFASCKWEICILDPTSPLDFSIARSPTAPASRWRIAQHSGCIAHLSATCRDTVGRTAGRGYSNARAHKVRASGAIVRNKWVRRCDTNGVDADSRRGACVGYGHARVEYRFAPAPRRGYFGTSSTHAGFRGRVRPW